MDQFQELVEQAPDGVAILVQGRIVFINATAARLLGVDRAAAIGTSITSYLPPADAAATIERIGRMLATGEPMAPNEYGTLANPDRVVEIKSVPWRWQDRQAVLAFARDVTERKAMQGQLLQAGRLAAVGTLAAGVAHEINNPLQYMQLSAHEARGALHDPERVAAYLTNIEHGIDRIATITRSLRAFARPRAPAPMPVDPVAVVDQALRMVGNHLRHRAQLVREIGEVPWVIANAPELEQVAVNLLLNAIQALTGKPDDTVTVALATRGDAVVLEVRDTGRGIPADVRERVFDPFFTTKPVGAGMGLGLSVSKGLVEAVGGRLELLDAPNGGAIARVTLRAHERAAGAAGAAETDSDTDTVTANVTDHDPDTVTATVTLTAAVRRRVLVLDDEARVRDTLGRLLGDHHEVTLAADGPTALAAVQAHAFDAILCDIMMAGMNGDDVYRRIAADSPGLERRIVFITGGAFVPEVRAFVAGTGNLVLEKPFQPAQVLAAIEAVAG